MCAGERLRPDPETEVKAGGPRGPAAGSAPPPLPRPAPAPAGCAPPRAAALYPARVPVSSPRGWWRGRHSLRLPPSAARISYQPSFRTFQAPSFQTPGWGGRARSSGSSASRLVRQVSAGPAARSSRVLLAPFFPPRPFAPGRPGSGRAASSAPLSSPLRPRLPDPSPAPQRRSTPQPARFPGSLPPAVDSPLQE